MWLADPGAAGAVAENETEPLGDDGDEWRPDPPAPILAPPPVKPSEGASVLLEDDGDK